jgi:hypothetical protein
VKKIYENKPVLRSANDLVARTSDSSSPGITPSSGSFAAVIVPSVHGAEVPDAHFPAAHSGRLRRFMRSPPFETRRFRSAAVFHPRLRYDHHLESLWSPDAALFVLTTEDQRIRRRSIPGVAADLVRIRRRSLPGAGADLLRIRRRRSQPNPTPPAKFGGLPQPGNVQNSFYTNDSNFQLFHINISRIALPQ